MSEKPKPRERRFILNGSPCDTNFYPDGPRTVAEAERLGRSPCPKFKECSSGKMTDYLCAIKFGVEVAANATREGKSVHAEASGDFAEFLKDTNPPKGFIWSSDRKEFTVIKDKRDALEKIEGFAAQVVDGVQKTPSTQTVGPNFENVIAYATTENGAIDLARMEKLEGRFGSNGGRGCDVLSGPCSCGAWH